MCGALRKQSPEEDRQRTCPPRVEDLPDVAVDVQGTRLAQLMLVEPAGLEVNEAKAGRSGPAAERVRTSSSDSSGMSRPVTALPRGGR